MKKFKNLDELMESDVVLMMAHRMPSTTVAAADASEVTRLEELMKQAEAAFDADGLVNEDAIASMLAAAWVSGAKEP